VALQHSNQLQLHDKLHHSSLSEMHRLPRQVTIISISTGASACQQILKRAIPAVGQVTDVAEVDVCKSHGAKQALKGWKPIAEEVSVLK